MKLSPSCDVELIPHTAAVAGERYLMEKLKPSSPPVSVVNMLLRRCCKGRQFVLGLHPKHVA